MDGIRPDLGRYAGWGERARRMGVSWGRGRRGRVAVVTAATVAAACLATVGPATPSWAATPPAATPHAVGPRAAAPRTAAPRTAAPPAAAARTGAPRGGVGRGSAGGAPVEPGEARVSGGGRIVLARPRVMGGGPTSATPGEMSGSAAVSTDDVWAVGAAPSSGAYVPFAEHWDGSTWTPVSVPAPPGASTSYLNAAAAVSSDDVWAVGAQTSATSGAQLTLIEHWDGTAWSVVPSPSLGTDLNMLNGVTAVSATDVWAVGTGLVNGIIDTQVLRWNGASWQIVASPNVSGVNANQLNQITAVSADNIWAVGYYAVLDVQYSTLAEHWNGTAWSIVNTPPIPTNDYDLQGVSAVSAHDILAVGYVWHPKVEQTTPLAERWNGTAWHRVPVTGPPLSAYLFVATAPSANDAWADGWFALANGDELPFTEHWDGTKWSMVTVPVPSATYSNVIGLAAISASDVWAVGSYQNQGGDWYPLYEHWNGQSWTMTTP